MSFELTSPQASGLSSRSKELSWLSHKQTHILSFPYNHSSPFYQPLSFVLKGNSANKKSCIHHNTQTHSLPEDKAVLCHRVRHAGADVQNPVQRTHCPADGSGRHEVLWPVIPVVGKRRRRGRHGVKRRQRHRQRDRCSKQHVNHHGQGHAPAHGYRYRRAGVLDLLAGERDVLEARVGEEARASAYKTYKTQYKTTRHNRDIWRVRWLRSFRPFVTRR